MLFWMFIGALYEKSLNIEFQCMALLRNNSKSLNPCRCSLSVTSVIGKYSDNSETMQTLQFFHFFWMLKKVKFYFEFKEKSQSEHKIN